MRYDEILNIKEIDGELRRNFLQEFILKYNNINEIAIEYYIEDGITPEQISSKVYNSSQYEWIIFLVNKIHNRNNDWPLNSTQLITYTQEKYGNLEGVHHYEDIRGNVVQDEEATPISNYLYEERLNNNKRNIHVPTLEFLEFFIREINKNMSNFT